jgi:hypothetical protein
MSDAPAVTAVFGRRARTSRPAGPVHAFYGPHRYQAWCGAKPQFQHDWWSRGVEDVTCGKCLTALRRGRPYARGSR